MRLLISENPILYYFDILGPVFKVWESQRERGPNVNCTLYEVQKI